MPALSPSQLVLRVCTRPGEGTYLRTHPDADRITAPYTQVVTTLPLIHSQTAAG